jgi:hypothetical protein
MKLTSTLLELCKQGLQYLHTTILIMVLFPLGQVLFASLVTSMEI